MTTSPFVAFASARSPALFRFAYLLVGDRGLAEDLLQETLTRTYAGWARLRDPANAEAYARKVMTSVAITWWHRKSWHAERPRGDVPETPTKGHAEDVAVRDWVWRELQSLPPRQRAAIVLRYYEDLSEAQTAEVLGCSVGTVKSQVFAGLRRLRDRLGADLIPNPDGEAVTS